MAAECDFRKDPHPTLEWALDEEYAFSAGWYPEQSHEIAPPPPYHRDHRGVVFPKYRKLTRKHQPPLARKENDEIVGIDDTEARANLARIIGLPKVPKKRWGAHKNLDGMFDTIMKHEKEIDPVLITRRIRRG